MLRLYVAHSRLSGLKQNVTERYPREFYGETAVALNRRTVSLLPWRVRA